ncbi:MAG: signal peptidase I [Pseudomonadota bacterium]
MPRHQQRSPGSKPKQSVHRRFGGFYDSAKFIIQVFVIALVIRTLVLEPFQIPSGSMIPNLLIGDRLMVSKYSYGYGKYSFPFQPFDFTGRLLGTNRPERGEVVVFRKPSEPDIAFIKRVIGLPGDKVQMRQGRLYVNDKPAARQRIQDFLVTNRFGVATGAVRQYQEQIGQAQSHRIIEQFGDNGPRDHTRIFTVPARHYFMMGDNRDASHDSRALYDVGFVPEEHLIGRAEFLFFSIEPGIRWWQFWQFPAAIRWSRIAQGIR